VLVGVTLARRGLSSFEVGGVAAALLAGIALASVLVARYADRLGRRRTYAGLLVVMAGAGTVFALSGSLPALLVAALTGTVSTDVVESGPFTSLEQAMLPRAAADTAPARLFATYNTIATATGSLGALAAGGPTLLHTGSARWLLAFPLVAALALPLALGISPAVEEPAAPGERPRLHRSLPTVRQLAALFALDSFGGGFVPQTLIAFLLAKRYGASAETIGAVFFGIGVLQAISFQLAGRLAGRIGLVRTMVFTHLPANGCLILAGIVPSAPAAIAFLLARAALSQMDVPARQALVMRLVEPDERAAAASITNVPRSLATALTPALAGALLDWSSFGWPLVIAGVSKATYDLLLLAQPLDRD